MKRLSGFGKQKRPLYPLAVRGDTGRFAPAFVRCRWVWVDVGPWFEGEIAPLTPHARNPTSKVSVFLRFTKSRYKDSVPPRRRLQPTELGFGDLKQKQSATARPLSLPSVDITHYSPVEAPQRPQPRRPRPRSRVVARVSTTRQHRCANETDHKSNGGHTHGNQPKIEKTHALKTKGEVHLPLVRSARCHGVGGASCGVGIRGGNHHAR